MYSISGDLFAKEDLTVSCADALTSLLENKYRSGPEFLNLYSTSAFASKDERFSACWNRVNDEFKNYGLVYLRKAIAEHPKYSDELQLEYSKNPQKFEEILKAKIQEGISSPYKLCKGGKVCVGTVQFRISDLLPGVYPPAPFPITPTAPEAEPITIQPSKTSASDDPFRLKEKAPEMVKMLTITQSIQNNPQYTKDIEEIQKTALTLPESAQPKESEVKKCVTALPDDLLDRLATDAEIEAFLDCLREAAGMEPKYQKKAQIHPWLLYGGAALGAGLLVFLVTRK